MAQPPNVADLATLADLKTWLHVAETTSDDVLQRLLTAQSFRFVKLAKLKGLILLPYSERRDGKGRSQMFVRNPPIVTGDSVQVNTTLIPASPDTVRPGWVNDAYSFKMIGGGIGPIWTGGTVWPPAPGLQYCFAVGFQNIVLNYHGGYGAKIIGEPATVPVTPYAITTLSQGQFWTEDDGVSYASSGLAFTPITSGTPTAGQYLVSLANNLGLPVVTYQFAAADTGQLVKVSYTTKNIPFDVSQAVLEMTQWIWRKRDRIDLDSENLGGMVSSFSKKQFPDSVQDILNQYTVKFYGDM